MLKILKNSFFLIFAILFLSQCSSFGKKDSEIAKKEGQIDEQPKKKRYKFNTDEKIKDHVEKEGGLIFNKPQKYQFGSRNIIWKASLEALSELPILSASYSGGVISTDWYGESNKQLRINVIFKSNEIATSSIKITSFVRECDLENQCNIKNGSENFNNQIKNKIFQKVKEINIAQVKNNKQIIGGSDGTRTRGLLRDRQAL